MRNVLVKDSSGSKSSMLSYLNSTLDWYDRDDSVFDLHFPFGKVSLDRTNRPVDRTYLRSGSVR